MRQPLPSRLVRRSRASKTENNLLPAAFYQVLTTNLYKWMRVYDYFDAQEHAEMWMEDLNDEESEASVYRKVDLEIPDLYQETR